MTDALLSIHDVMPATRARVEALSDQARALGWPPPILLVVPGSGWDAGGIAWLQACEAAGHTLAGHGWQHRITHYGGIRHRLHAALISRDVAEHLSLDAEGVLALMRRCHAWFGEHGLTPPALYVPPAWALGPVPRQRLREQPFARIETLRGVYTHRTGQWQHRALLGYEAGNALQKRALVITNALGRWRARRAGLRIGLHPDDAELPLAASLWRDLERFSPRRRAGG